nr:putative uncharacterized protein DDB_G0282133 [Dermatophagoides farinae]
MPQLHKIYFSEIRAQQEFPDLTGTNSIEHIRLDRLRLSTIDSRLCNHVGKTLKSLIVKSNKIQRLPPMDFCIEIRLLDASYNEIKTIESKTFYNQHKLIDLSLNHNQIETIAFDSFTGLSNLKVLNMENNLIRWIDPNAFLPLQSLRDLNLGHNKFPELPTAGLMKIMEIKVHGNRNLRDFPPIESFPYVQTLAMSYAYHCCPYLGRMQVINPEIVDSIIPSVSPSTSDFQDSILWLEDVDDTNVNLTITELAQQFWKLYHPHQPAPIPNDLDDPNHEQNNYDMFVNDFYAAIETPAAVNWGNMMDSDEYIGDKSAVYFQQNDRITNKPIKCLPKPDPFMPCQDLFEWWTLRFGVWVVFPLALIGNGTVLIVLVFGRRKRRRSSKLDVPRFLVCNLAAADFFMGIYLGMLAIVDMATLGYFRSHAIRWQNSFICQLTGFAGVFSAELSVYTLAVITLERNYAITHAMHLNKRLSLRAAVMVMSIGWFFALFMAILPLFGVSDYRKVAVCLPFEIDNLVSFIYIISLIVFNGIAFILLMACYLRMYCAIRGSQAWNSNDTRIAIRMGLLVFTDFLCWAPIAFFTITTLAGWHLITVEEAKIFTIFVLPLNACANPFLYAFFTKQFKKECTNLYKRVDASKLFKSRTRCFGGRQSTVTDPNSPQIVSDCKVCVHNHPINQRNSDQSPHHPNTHRIQSIVSSNKKRKQESDSENNDNDNDNDNNNNDINLHPINNPIKNKEIDEQQQKQQDHHDCQCQCHNKTKINPFQISDDKRNRIRSIESDNGDRSYTSQFIRQFIPSLSMMNTNSRFNNRIKRSNAGKQFKSNSIIYQSNYRKNHIHMTLENEIQSPTSQNKSNSDNSDHKKQTPTTTNKTNSSSSSTKHNEHESSHNRGIDVNKNDNAVVMIVSERDGSNSNTVTEYQQKQRHDSIRNGPIHYVKHQNPASAMTTGILMLKNKLIRNNQKNYARKMSSDSQFEFSHYSNRKDSTSTTGRLSFSSDNPTKSTSSSFFSSGFSSSSSRTTAASSTANTATIIAGDLLLSQDQFERIIEQSSIFTEQMKRYLMDNTESIEHHEILNILNGSKHEERFILIAFIEQKFCNEDRKQRSNNDSDLNDCDSIQIDNEMSDDQYVLYLLQEIDSSSSARNRCSYFLKVLLLFRKQCSMETDCLKRKLNAIIQLECIEHRLIDKFMQNLNESRINYDEFDFENLAIHSMIFQCHIRLYGRELDEINEETNSQTNGATGSNNRLEEPNKKSQTSLMSSSHERIMNFLQILLPKSNKQNTQNSHRNNNEKSGTYSFYRKPRVKKPLSVVTKPIRSGHRRSSSAFALSEELLEQFHQQHIPEMKSFYEIKSCTSQLQVVGSTSPSSNSHKSDSIPEIRSRSAISDVIIRVNNSHSSNIDKDDFDNPVIESQMAIIKPQITLSDREISYKSLNIPINNNNNDDNNNDNNFSVEKNEHRYHSYEFIMI